MNATSLDAFFGAMRGLLDGERDARDVIDCFGPCRSGAERLGLYRTLVARQSEDVLRALFPAVRAAANALRPGAWEELSVAFLRAHPPRHWEPNRVGEPFAEFLEGARERDPSLPAYLEELADYAWIRFAASIADPPDGDVGLDASLFVRRYDHDVVAYTDAPHGAPARSPRAIIVYASRLPAGGVRVLDASLAALVAIGWRVSGTPRATVARADLDAADASLVAHGVLAPRAARA